MNSAIGAAMQGILVAFNLLGIRPTIDNVLAMFLLAASKLDTEARASVFASIDHYLTSDCENPDCPFHGSASNPYTLQNVLDYTASEVQSMSETLDDDTLQRMFDTPDVPTIEAAPEELASDFDEYDDIAEGLGIDRRYLYDKDDDE